MEDFFKDLYDKKKNDDEEEPSFSLYEFKKWLSKQNKEKEKKIKKPREEK
jgi:hypothetical protein